jgi:hypothetical protein
MDYFAGLAMALVGLSSVATVSPGVNNGRIT